MRCGWARGPSTPSSPSGEDGGVFRLPRRRASTLGAESGVSSLEMLGIMLVVGTVVGAIAFTVSGEKTSEQMGQAFCGITGGQGCGPSSGGSTDVTSASGEKCIGAPAGAAGPVRGSVPVPSAGSGGAPGLTIAVMGDGTYQVSGGAATDVPPSSTWVGSTFGPAAPGTESYLRGGSPQVYTVNSTAGLADLLASDRQQSWAGAVVGEGGAVSGLADAARGLVGGGGPPPVPDAVYTDLSAQGGLSLNAYDQTLALDAGGEAVGVLRRADGSSTEYVGVSESTEGVSRASDVVPMLLESDRDPGGNLVAVRTVTDREFTPSGPSTASGSLYVTHLDVASSGGSTVVSDLASTLGSSTLTGSSPSSIGTSPPSFASATTALRDAATADGYVTRQEPAGTVSVEDPNADPVSAGLAQVMRSPAPQAWDGTAWTARLTGCSS